MTVRKARVRARALRVLVENEGTGTHVTAPTLADGLEERRESAHRRQDRPQRRIT